MKMQFRFNVLIKINRQLNLRQVSFLSQVCFYDTNLMYLFTNIGGFILLEIQIEEFPLCSCSSSLGYTQHEDSRRARVLITFEVNVLDLHFLLLPYTVPAQFFTLQCKNHLQTFTFVWTQKVVRLVSQVQRAVFVQHCEF